MPEFKRSLKFLSSLIDLSKYFRLLLILLQVRNKDAAQVSIIRLPSVGLNFKRICDYKTSIDPTNSFYCNKIYCLANHKGEYLKKKDDLSDSYFKNCRNHIKTSTLVKISICTLKYSGYLLMTNIFKLTLHILVVPNIAQNYD
ncbi:unnamed protein product [Moneuplotes crassus]|uniref:Uncharacterized protein n=1 Tax=Euplotes crassus TaxID=5936 RepID=A0AAD1X748_EUPCR|nr:unnamed protein product [Moneuplotes crassus]